MPKLEVRPKRGKEAIYEKGHRVLVELGDRLHKETSS